MTASRTALCFALVAALLMGVQVGAARAAGTPAPQQLWKTYPLGSSRPHAAVTRRAPRRASHTAPSSHGVSKRELAEIWIVLAVAVGVAVLLYRRRGLPAVATTGVARLRESVARSSERLHGWTPSVAGAEEPVGASSGELTQTLLRALGPPDSAGVTVAATARETEPAAPPRTSGTSTRQAKAAWPDDNAILKEKIRSGIERAEATRRLKAKLAAERASRRAESTKRQAAATQAPQAVAAGECSISWWRGQATSMFYAAAVLPDGEDLIFATSPEFEWWSQQPPRADRTDVREAHEAVVRELEREGWEACGRGDEWFELRFRRLDPPEPEIEPMFKRQSEGES